MGTVKNPSLGAQENASELNTTIELSLPHTNTSVSLSSAANNPYLVIQRTGQNITTTTADSKADVHLATISDSTARFACEKERNHIVKSLDWEQTRYQWRTDVGKWEIQTNEIPTLITATLADNATFSLPTSLVIDVGDMVDEAEACTDAVKSSRDTITSTFTGKYQHGGPTEDDNPRQPRSHVGVYGGASSVLRAVTKLVEDEDASTFVRLTPTPDADTCVTVSVDVPVQSNTNDGDTDIDIAQRMKDTVVMLGGLETVFQGNPGHYVTPPRDISHVVFRTSRSTCEIIQEANKFTSEWDVSYYRNGLWGITPEYVITIIEAYLAGGMSIVAPATAFTDLFTPFTGTEISHILENGGCPVDTCSYVAETRSELQGHISGKISHTHNDPHSEYKTVPRTRDIDAVAPK